MAYDAAGHRDTGELSRVYLAQRGVRSVLAFPIRLLERVTGMLMVEHSGSQRNWTPDDSLSVQQMADAATRALSNRQRIQLQDEIKQLNEQLRLSNGFAAAHVATLARHLGDIARVLSAYRELDAWLYTTAPDKSAELERIKKAANLDQLERELVALLEAPGTGLPPAAPM